MHGRRRPTLRPASSRRAEPAAESRVQHRAWSLRPRCPPPPPRSCRPERVCGKHGRGPSLRGPLSDVPCCGDPLSNVPCCGHPLDSLPHPPRRAAAGPYRSPLPPPHPTLTRAPTRDRFVPSGGGGQPNYFCPRPWPPRRPVDRSRRLSRPPRRWARAADTRWGRGGWEWGRGRPWHLWVYLLATGALRRWRSGAVLHPSSSALSPSPLPLPLLWAACSPLGGGVAAVWACAPPRAN